jgi:hypothetical protein
VACERVLTTRELNRALLARQLLLKRERLTAPRAIERVGALQAQWPPSPHVALWSRLVGFRREHLMRALERRRVVKATLMRTTLHHVSARDYLAYAGELDARRIRSLEAQLSKVPAGGPDVDDLVEQIVRRASERPRSRAELLALLGQPELVVDERRPWLVWHLLCARASLVHAPQASQWRLHTAGVAYVPAEHWLGHDGAVGEDAVVHLLRRYLSAFGPASRADASQWTGLPVSALEPAIERLPLHRYRDEDGRTLYDMRGAPLPPASAAAPPRFLPKWDSTLLAHADRTRILPERHRKAVIQGGDVQSTFLVDGFVAGIWRVDGGRVALEPFEPIPRTARRELEAEASALAEFYAPTV